MLTVNPRSQLPPFIISPTAFSENEKPIPCEIMESPLREVQIIVEPSAPMSEVEEAQEEYEAEIKAPSEHSGPENEYHIDDIFYRISYFCFLVGVNFYRDRPSKLRCFSLAIVIITCSINIYFIGYLIYLLLSKPFDANRVATSISICTWVLQATLSTFFLAFWQHTSLTCKILKRLYEANQGIGIHHHRQSLNKVLRMFYIVIAFSALFYIVLMISNFIGIDFGYMDKDISKIFGHRRLFLIVQLTSLYTIVCWAVAMFIFSLLVHSTYYEFVYFNDQVRSLTPRDKRRRTLEPICTQDHSVERNCTILPKKVVTTLISHLKIKPVVEYHTDEELSNYLLRLMKIHNGLIECVMLLDKMFNRYAFVMISTIIPTTIFSLFMVFSHPKDIYTWVSQELLFSCPLVIFCVFSFMALVNGPSKLHNTIYNTKSSLCANTLIWFPYRPNVYHSALAFVCHLDQANLGVSIWGFAVVSKKLVLTTLSVMITILALFLEMGDCSANNQKTRDN